MNYVELWEMIKKPYLTAKEISKIGFCGMNKASKIKRDILSRECKDWLLPYGKVPTEIVLDRMHIKSTEVFKNAKMEIEILKVR